MAQLDMEIGHLQKSPCKDCQREEANPPACRDNCETLAKVQSALAETTTTTNSRDTREPYNVPGYVLDQL